MTPYEFTEINRKYGFQTTFNSKLKAMSKEEYERMVKGLVVVFEAIYNDDSNEEDDFKWQRDIKR